jgi:Ni/Co efflux regulator RcnB
MYDVMVSALVETFVQSVRRVQLSGNTCESCSREKIHLFAILCASPVLMRSSRAVNIPTVTEMIRLCKRDPTCDLSTELEILVNTLRQLEAKEEEEAGLPVDYQSLNFEAVARPKLIHQVSLEEDSPEMAKKEMTVETQNKMKEEETEEEKNLCKPPVDQVVRTRERQWQRGIQIARQRRKEMLVAGWKSEDLGCTGYPNRPRLSGDPLMDPRA